MAKLIATVGGLIICAGLDLLWQSRLQIRYWVETYVQFLSAMWRRQISVRMPPSAAMLVPRPGSMQVLLGLGFSLFLGPALLLVGLALVLHLR